MPEISDENFMESVRKNQIPILVLDQKWHHLFLGPGKPEKIAELEKNVDDVLARQGFVNTEIKELKKAKSTLMENIVQNMDDSETELIDKKMSERTRLINEINEKMEAYEDEQLDIPVLLKESNEALMMETMRVMYERLHSNAANVSEIKEWIATMRIELKKNIIRKQEMEVKNQEIYSYMHDIFGASVLDLFDIRFEDQFEEKQ